MPLICPAKLALLLPAPRILYLHGFASSPNSRKALFFKQKLGELGIGIEIPDLTEDNFERLTVGGQLKLIEDRLANQPAVLIGSSLGGYLAALYAARHPEVTRVLLLAPAFGFYQLWTAALGPERLARWKNTGNMLVFHYGQGRDVPLSFQFLEDAARFEPFPDMYQQTLICHGDQDSVVPVEQSLAFHRNHPQSRLIRFASGHELTDVLEDIWEASRDFLLEGLPR